jgi:hypothetical protein
MVVNNNAFYATPTPSVYTAAPNTLNSNCTLSTSGEPNAVVFSGMTSDLYVPGWSPTQLITNCEAEGGTLYSMMVLLYDQNFQPTIDKNSAVNMTFSCNWGEEWVAIMLWSMSVVMKTKGVM